MNTILSVDEITPDDVLMQIARNVRERRLEKNLTQEGIAIRAGIPLPTYRKFERTGEISLRGLSRIAFALNLLHELESLFAQRQYQTLDDVIAETENKRKRGKINE